MSQFFTPLVYENRNGRIILWMDFHFQVADAEVIRVPKDFSCDGQSMPRPLWVIDNPHGRGGRAGVVHDYLYWLNGATVCPKSGYKLPRSYSRKDADQIYYQALKRAGLGGWRAKIRYWGLRMFGWKAWLDHAERIFEEQSVRPLMEG